MGTGPINPDGAHSSGAWGGQEHARRAGGLGREAGLVGPDKGLPVLHTEHQG